MEASPFSLKASLFFPKGYRLGKQIEKRFGQKVHDLMGAVEADDETMIQLIQAGAGFGVIEAGVKTNRAAIWRGRTLTLGLFFTYLDVRNDIPKSSPCSG
jgi:hypothetical protein